MALEERLLDDPGDQRHHKAVSQRGTADGLSLVKDRDVSEQLDEIASLLRQLCWAQAYQMGLQGLVDPKE